MRTLFITLGLLAAATAHATTYKEICILNKINEAKFKSNTLSAKITENAGNSWSDDVFHYLDVTSYSNESCITFAHVDTESRSPKYGNVPTIKFNITGQYYLSSDYKHHAFSPVQCETSPFYSTRYTAVITANDDGELLCNIERTS